ncbi:MAG: ComF family protein [Candidatus Riflebacteria bacterium]|nr:ComF family protein [Candidatus Riflebacteria bacterium]
MNFKELIDEVLSVFFSFSCLLCSEDAPFNQVLCSSCYSEIAESFFPPEQVYDTCCDFQVFTVSSYKRKISDAMRVVKYRPSEKLLRTVAALAAKKEELKKFFVPEQDVIVPIPMHPKRLSERGFNQAEVLGLILSKVFLVPYSPCLVRNRHTKAQAACAQDERMNNLAGAFSLADGLDKTLFKNKRLILLDDVVTTGSTLQECSKPLYLLEPDKIIGFALSHSFKRS